MQLQIYLISGENQSRRHLQTFTVHPTSHEICEASDSETAVVAYGSCRTPCRVLAQVCASI